MKKGYLASLVKKYLSGKITDDEKEFLEQEWEKSLEEDQYVGRLDNEKKIKIRTELLENIKQTIVEKEGGKYFNDEQIKDSNFAQPKKPHFWFNLNFLKYAAIFVGLLIISTYSYFYFFQVKELSYSTAFGETLNILLPDSSVVTLNSNSNIRFKERWNRSETRDIWLEGEAFFSVIHKYNHQEFRVHASGLEVKALGTKFNVNNRRKNIWVVLNSGTVSLNPIGSEENIILQPGELAEFSSQKNEFNRIQVNPEIYTSWRNKKLVFEKTSLEKIAEILEDNYGLKVQIEDQELAEMTFSATIPTDSLDILLSVLSESFNINITKNQEEIILTRQ